MIHLFNTQLNRMWLACLLLLPLLVQAQVPSTTQTVRAQPATNPNFKIDPKLKLNLALQKLTNGSRKRWVITSIHTNGYDRAVDASSCYADNELILSSDQSANYTEGQKICTKSKNALTNLQWQISSDGKKLTLTGLPVIEQDNSNAMIGFLLGSESEILELTDTTLHIRFKATDGYIEGKFFVVTNEIVYTAK